MGRAELLDDYEALKALADEFEAGASLHKPHPSGGFHDIALDEREHLVLRLNNVVAYLRRLLSSESTASEPPEVLAETVLELDMDTGAKQQVIDTLRTFVGHERASCAALVEQVVARWSVEHPDDELRVSIFVDEMKKLAELIRARGRTIS